MTRSALSSRTLPRVPERLELPADADAELQARVAAVNEFLDWAREHLGEMEERLAKIENMRSANGVHQAPDGLVIF